MIAASWRRRSAALPGAGSVGTAAVTEAAGAWFEIAALIYRPPCSIRYW